MNSTTTSNLINLQSLIDLSAALNASDSDAFILNTALLSVMGKLRTFKAVALIPGEKQGIWRVATTKGLKLPEGDLEVDFQTNHLGTVQNIEQLTFFCQHGIVLCQTVSHNRMAEYENLKDFPALLCFGTNLAQEPYTEEEEQYISLVASITANALLNANNMRSLRETGSYLERKNQLLTTLFEINREFTALLEKEEILKFLTLRLMGQLAVSRFAVLVKENTDDNSFSLPINRLKITPEEAQSLTNLYHEQGEEALAQCSKIMKECVLAVPMKTQNVVKGILLVGAKMNKQPFTTEEQNFLEALGGTAMTALENARLFHEELEKKRLEDELNLARTIQKGLLPQELPDIEGFDITGMSVSSKQIGGDYYDVIPLGNSEWLLVIADVSGKGTPAALLMANTQAALRALAPLQLPLPAMVSQINDLLYANTSSDKFVTFFCGKLNAQERTFTFCNAGHNPPLVCRANGSIERLQEGGLILGIMETLVPYQEATIRFECGDVLLCYTDGVSESLNELSEEFTEEQLEDSLRTRATLSAQTIIEHIVADVHRHAGSAPQSDDITMLILRCQ